MVRELVVNHRLDRELNVDLGWDNAHQQTERERTVPAMVWAEKDDLEPKTGGKQGQNRDKPNISCTHLRYAVLAALHRAVDLAFLVELDLVAFGLFGPHLQLA